MKLLLCVLIMLHSVNSFAQSDESEILRLKKGEYYYHYLTGDFPRAMNQLAQWRSNGGAIADEADVMEAAMLLSLGLHQQAQAIFERIQQTGSSASAQSWFYLARRWFELGDFQAALYSIKQIDSAGLNAEVIAETQFMKATSYIELGLHKQAGRQIAAMSRDGIWTGYARHNYILAMFDGNNSGQSLSLLIENATFYLPVTEEGRNLRDRIHLISALHYLQGGKNRSAEKHLKSISLESPYTPVALLQYGWAMVEQGKYDQALQPWRELQTRFNPFDPEVMESMLGVPHVLELIRAYTQSLKTYEVAEARLSTMKATVNTINQGIADNPWLEDWIVQQKDQNWGWQANIEKTMPLNETSKVFKHLLVDDGFVNKVTEYRDLVLLTDYLSEKENNLRLWVTLVDKRERESKAGMAVPVLNKTRHQLALAKLDLKNLQAYLEQSDRDLYALPSVQEENKIALLARTAKTIEKLVQVNKASRNIDQYQHRWARVKGVFLWQMNEDKPVKQWQLKKELTAVETLIKQADIQFLETRLAHQWSPSSWLGMKERVLHLLQKTSAIKQVALQVKQQSKAALVAQTRSYLDDLSYRINDYMSQARLSIARLYDDALQRYVISGAITEKAQ